ncbi:expressed unknown protein [Ectocarpus siliculosus]|uniref:Uncharacterized protein n=1 Tax=Ectocarpus siliculosus TaxID=2880 RepID=D7G5F9_ECTSI|nr:expressed unknown protein [Ectocarpus siliculosus]|eukprot:CBJ33853.1 expressed unknown protein [Ectocarpus siliculosus]
MSTSKNTAAPRSRAGAARGGAAVAASPIAPSRGRHLKPTNIITLAQVSHERRLIKPLSTSALLPTAPAFWFSLPEKR